jgi:hypothetical protein
VGEFESEKAAVKWEMDQKGKNCGKMPESEKTWEMGVKVGICWESWKEVGK